METRPTMATGLGASVESSDGAGRIALDGRLDRDGEAVLSDAYAAATADSPSVIDLDFSRIDYINSTGIALVVRLLADARRDGRTVRARGLSEHYREIFTITRLSDFMTIVDEEEEGQA